MKVAVDLPDELQQEVSFTFTGRALEYQMQTAVAAALVEANATIKTLQDAAKEQARAFDVLSDDSGVLFDENKRFTKTIADQADQLKQRDALISNLKMQLVEALKGTPPPVIEPVPPAPPVVPVTPGITNELAVTIVDNGSYGDALKSRLLDYLNHIAKSDIRRVILFQNKQQMIQDEFPRQMLDRGLQWDADTIWSVWRTTTPPERVKYLETAERFKVQGFHADDAQNNTPEELADMVKFMRGYTDKPIYASFRADDTKILPDGKRVSFDMQAYKDAGLLITRQFFRQGEPVAVLDGWLKSGRITDGVNLEAFKEGAVTTSPAEFEMMLEKCLAAGIPFLSVYTVVESAKWQMWSDAPALWAKVNAMAVQMREARIVKAQPA